jgi:2-hydroxychromene-2-carboxylate isomerase
MSIRSLIAAHATAWFTGADRQAAQHARAERRRRARGDRHVIEFFHDVADPLAHLAAAGLAQAARRYDVEIAPFLTDAPEPWAVPEPHLHRPWARLDAARLAARAGIDFAPTAAPDPGAIAHAEQVLAGRLRNGTDFLEAAVEVGSRLWSGAELPPATADVAATAAAKAAGSARRAERGHFLGGAYIYGNEWYLGLDRLHHLEARLSTLGARRPGAPDAPVFAPPPSPAPSAAAAPGARPVIHFYLSFRSPYTWIATPRIKAIADDWGADLRLAFVLPMVMRGLPVPPAKGRSFTLDTAREARSLGIPFGRICDPVGRPVERGYAILPHAIAAGRGYDFCRSFMQAVWSEGVDAGEDAGLRRIVEAAGLDWTVARGWLDDDGWRAQAEANRLELDGLGLWGVPSFRVGDVATWGQDRLWVIEDALAAAHRG